MRQNWQFEVIKEPKGFIKLIQIFVAIFAFATCTGFRGYTEFKQKCNNVDHTTGAKFKYPFKETLIFDVHERQCKVLAPVTVSFDYKSSMQFYVTIGVFCFLYSLGVLAYYIFFEPEQSQPAQPPGKFSAPVIDFLISVFFVVFWFAGAIACAASVTGIKSKTEATKIIPSIPNCFLNTTSCRPSVDGNYATLDISALLGFLNVFVWCGNLWFLYKETPWHTPKNTSAATVPGTQTASDPPPPASAI